MQDTTLELLQKNNSDAIAELNHAELGLSSLPIPKDCAAPELWTASRTASSAHAKVLARVIHTVEFVAKQTNGAQHDHGYFDMKLPGLKGTHINAKELIGIVLAAGLLYGILAFYGLLPKALTDRFNERLTSMTASPQVSSLHNGGNTP